MSPFRANSTHVLPNTMSLSSSSSRIPHTRLFSVQEEYETSTLSRRVKVDQRTVRKIKVDTAFKAGTSAGSVGGAGTQSERLWIFGKRTYEK